MKLSESIKPITYLKSHAADVLRDVAEHRQTIVITQNGEAKAVVQDIKTFEETQETLALLKLLAQGRRSIDEGRTKPVRRAFKDVRKAIAQRSK